MDRLPPREQIEAALEELLGWPPIARSPQLARFLNYIVTATLSGEEAGIKAYAIAVDVFGRPQSFDPQSDPIVRVQARRLRALLDQFYDEGHATAGIRIHLPVGRYVPEFGPLVESSDDSGRGADPLLTPDPPANENRSLPPELLAGPPPRRFSLMWPGVIAAAVISVIGGALYLTQQPAPEVPVANAPPEQPVVAIGEFSNISGDAALDGFSAAIGDGVRLMLGRFEDLTLLPAGEEPGAGGYRLTGVIHAAEPGAEVTASLVGAGSDAIWTATFLHREPMSVEAPSTVATAIVRDVAPFRGPLHERGRRWVDEEGWPLTTVGSYVCMLRYHLARETGQSNHIAQALACIDRLLADDSDQPLALSAAAWLDMRAIVNRQLGEDSLVPALEVPLERARRAQQLTPESSTVHEHLGTIQNWMERFDGAQQDFVESLRLNPLNTDARALYAIMLARNGQWELSAEQAALAIRDTPYSSPWYYFPAALGAFREGRFAEAIEHGQRAMGFGGGEAGSLVVLAAAGLTGRTDIAEPLLPRVMAMEALRRGGMITWFSGQLRDASVLGEIGRGLISAGVPQAALTAAF